MSPKSREAVSPSTCQGWEPLHCSPMGCRALTAAPTLLLLSPSRGRLFLPPFPRYGAGLTVLGQGWGSLEAGTPPVLSPPAHLPLATLKRGIPTQWVTLPWSLPCQVFPTGLLPSHHLHPSYGAQSSIPPSGCQGSPAPALAAAEQPALHRGEP